MAVTSATLLDSTKNVTMAFTGEDSEAAVLKVDVSALNGAPSRVSIEKIKWATQGMAVNILWDATTDVIAWVLPPDSAGEIDFCDIGGLKNNAGSGITGDIMFTTVGHAAGDTYSIILCMKKS